MNNISVADPVVDPLDNSVSGITAAVSRTSSGTGGQLDIESDRLRVYNGGQIIASTEGAGNAGSIKIKSGIIEVEGTSRDGLFNSSIESRSTTGFNAGSVSLRASDGVESLISIRDRGTVSVSSLAGGDAGNVTLKAKTISLNNGSVRAEASAGNQGNLTVESGDVLLLRQGSRLTANATETATGGNIALSSPVIVGLENSDISANAVEGDGGSIQLVTNGLVGIALRDRLTTESDITASSEFGVSGTIDVESPNVDTDSGLVQLPDGLVDASNQVTAACAAQNDNQFASTGQGGLPNNPLQQLSSNRPWQDLRETALAPTLISDRIITNAAELPSASEGLVEAGQWQLNAGGEVVLVADRALAHPDAACLQKSM